MLIDNIALGEKVLVIFGWYKQRAGRRPGIRRGDERMWKLEDE